MVEAIVCITKTKNGNRRNGTNRKNVVVRGLILGHPERFGVSSLEEAWGENLQLLEPFLKLQVRH